MSNWGLIIGDTLFVFVVIMINATHGFKNNPVLLVPLTLVALATCVIRHVNYYKQMKRIY
jgi:hypothetical protein